VSGGRSIEHLKVTRTARGIYEVKSESEKDVKYIVDLLDNDGLGGCNCKNFLMSKLPRFERNGRIPFESLRCKHIVAARCQFTDAIILGIINTEKHQQH